VQVSRRERPVDGRAYSSMPVLDAELEAALRATEQSFHVQLIGTFAPDLVCAPANEQATPWLAANHPDFDQFPVRNGELTIGILARSSEYGGKTVAEAMQPLSEGLIVSAGMPISELIPQLGVSHSRLVLRGERIDGLVTRSDLLKLPVRMLIFGLISHLEMCCRELIRQRVPWPKWSQRLGPERRRAMLKKLGELKSARLEPDPLEFSTFNDAIQVLAQEPDLGMEFQEEAKAVLGLRNDIAHAKTFISSASDVQDFVNRFNSTHALLGRLSKMLRTA
jgi:hypothetical protein